MKRRIMKKYDLKNMTLGWFIGNFEPSIFKTADFEIAIKRFKSGEVEPQHYQKISKEITVIVSGKVEIAKQLFIENDIVEIDPFEVADFRAITDCILIAIKLPSLPNDKFLV